MLTLNMRKINYFCKKEIYYGNKNNNTLRVIFNERLLHPFQPYNKEATANQIDYFETVLGFSNKIDSSNQIWQYKELLTLINMILSLVMIVPLTRTLLRLKIFSALIKPVPEPLPAQTKDGKIVFWSIFFVSATIACVTFIPMVGLSKIFFVEAANRELTWFFPQRMNNSVMLWAALNGTIGLIIFFLSYYFFGRHHGT